MIHQVNGVVLRRPEPADLDALYRQKNDPEVAVHLGGFSTGYTRSGLVEWMEFHRKKSDEVLWVIADAETDACLGHVGLYRIDHRIRSAEFAIMIGAKDRWGKGLGKSVSRYMVDYGFRELNLNRIELTALAGNLRAISLYESLGFLREGMMRQAQFKDGVYQDVVMMSILRGDWEAAR
jgi:[ribosomal protein S5]-alanine N-acetyltransferase